MWKDIDRLIYSHLPSFTEAVDDIMLCAAIKLGEKQATLHLFATTLLVK